MFSFERLAVYREILRFIAAAEDQLATWDNKHCVGDHFSRALESIIVNLAEACREHTLPAKKTAIDYSLGSILESAACLDVSEVKAFLDSDSVRKKKEDLASIFGGLIGLRKSWQEKGVNEDGSIYSTPSGAESPIFHHERLKVYQFSMQVLQELTTSGLLDRLPSSSFRRIDQTVTSIILNIAEGNGRYAKLDHRRFLIIANRSTSKLAALVDVFSARGIWVNAEVLEIKDKLRNIDRITAAMLRD